MTSDQDFDNTPHQARHVLAVASTTRGKGVGFVIPKLIAFEGEVVVYDRGREYRRLPGKGDAA